MSYNVNQKATLGQLKSLAQRAKGAIDSAIQALPTEMFLDQAKTAFIPNFAFNGTTYAGASNPNLDGKPVLVLAVKGIDHTNNNAETTTYSFLDVSTLVDTYTAKTGASAQILNISGYEIEVKFDNTLTTSANGLGVAVSAVANNAITKQSDGLHVNITGKADKVDRATAAEAQNPYDSETESANYAAFNSSYVLTGHVAGLDASGNLTDTGIVAANVLTTANITTDAEVEEALNGVFGSSGSGD